ncbi:uncharacterized protein LOC124126110 isoform X2 [Haliotis rufescens]|uniref:uncharacterized protein LOC124126110 isoform X2 n=1 Tax=Haliotis rufescens TaxID=6454 RepID=UPI00201F471C|nr:uncharacterized protein LOC124126110 isoform X2 [Haliotis rufescens]
MTEDAKKRRPNFTKEESLLLAELVASNKVVLEGKFGPGITSLKRQEAWQVREMITDTLNASLMHRRTKEEVEKKWKNLKSQSKKAFSNLRQQTIATGGGPPPIPVSPVTDAVVEAIGRDNMSLTGISNSCDSTALQLLDVMTSRESGEVEDMANVFNVPERTCQCQNQTSMEALNKEKLVLEIECLKLRKEYLTKKIYKVEE